MTAATLLGFDAVTCLRGGRILFEDLHLKVGAGDALIVSGPNGAGKSSLLRLAAGLLRPLRGTIDRPAPVALADEAPALDDRLTLRAALEFWARIDGADAGAGIDAMGLSPIAHVPVRLLSTGQRKRATLARVIAGGAALWLFDEPANGLDGDGLDRLAAAIARHRSAGGALIAASHQTLPVEAADSLTLGSA